MGKNRIRVGIGGWDYDPWRETFYPADVPKKRALEYASRQVTAIEVNGTYYGTFKPETYANWHAQTPDDFMFSVKALRYTTNRKVLTEAGESVDKFINSGLSELDAKLGPIVWQLAPSKRFDADDLEAFFKLLPDELGKLKLRHVLDPRHESFLCEEYLALARKHKIATVFTDSEDYPSFADITSDFVYARLMSAQSDIDTGYSKPALKKWAARAELWSSGGQPDDLPYAGEQQGKSKERDVFIYFINGAKERAPAAAQHLIKTLTEKK
ncbi:DUF72 domain-containing protein [Undibacterium sp. TJN25]|uniref:DUF72 domain-containing protein n=1 Tax=Undibacterium sp. TJN25 TaxID=3413056 RepID=UPI003BF11B9E